MAKFELVGFVQHIGGEGSIVGGGGEVVDLPAGSQSGDLVVLTLCAAVVNFDPDALDEDGFPIPVDGRDWTGFMVYPNDSSDVPFALAAATILGDDLGPVPLVYGGGFFGFLDEGYTITVYRGVKSILGTDLGPPGLTWDPDSPVRFGSPDMAHTDTRARCVLAAIGERSSGVPGFPTGDLTADYSTVALTWPGFNATRTVIWRTDVPRGLRWLEYAGGADFIPEGQFTLDGLTPTYAVGVMYLELDDVIDVTRQYPRDDGYGLIGGPRLYPPPRRGRVFGGQQ